MKPLQNIFHYLQKLALVFWLGEMLFFIVIFAPRVFKVLPREMAAELQSHIFPGYFMVGIVCSFVMLLGFAINSSRANWGRYQKPIYSLGTLVAGLIFVYCFLSLSPEIAEMSRQGLGQTPEFTALHKLSVRLNAIVLFLLLTILAII